MKFAPRVLFVTLVLALTAVVSALTFASSLLKPAPVSNASASFARPLTDATSIPQRAADQVMSWRSLTAVAQSVPTATPSASPQPTTIPALPPPTPPRISSAAYQQGMLLRRDGDYAHAAESFRAALADRPDPSTLREIRFRLGETSWLAGDMTTAASAFEALLAQNSKDDVAARAHYFLGEILTQQKSYTQAIAHLRAYRAQSRALIGEIDSQIGDILLQSGNATGAIAQYNVALQDPTMTSAQRTDLLERISGVQSGLGHPELAVARLGEAYDSAPDNQTRADVEYRWGVQLASAGQLTAAVTHWQHALAAFPDQDGGYRSLVELVNRQVPVDDFQRGFADYFSGSYAPAVQAFDRYIAANPKNSASALYYQGLAYFESGQNLSAVASFATLLHSFPKDKHAADALFTQARAYDRAYRTDDAVATYGQFTDRYPNDSRADDALWKAGQSLDVDGRHTEARSQYSKLDSKYPSSPLTATSLFNVGFDDYLSQDYANAAAQWKTVAKLFPNSVEGDRAFFWLGKLTGSQGDPTSSQQYLKQAAKAPRSYYSWRALDLLEPTDYAPSYDVSDYAMSADPNDRVKFEQWLAGWTAGGPVSSKLGTAVLNDFHFRRGTELAQIDQAAQARLEFEKVNSRFQSDARSLYSLAAFYQENNYFDLSVHAALQIQSLAGVTADEQLPHYLRTLIYPTYYADLIVPYAQRNSVDPAILFALIRQESTYNPLSKSWVGAAGLTQVMPSTGSGIARDLGVGSFQQADLLKPYVSIRFGAYFLGSLFKYFDGNVFYALGGYNGGPGNARKWMRPDVDVGVEAIDLPESSLYVHTVYSQYNQYIEIYRSK